MRAALSRLAAGIAFASVLAGATFTETPTAAQAAEPVGVFLTHADYASSATPRSRAAPGVEAVFFTRGTAQPQSGYECVPIAELAVVGGHPMKRQGQVCRAVRGGPR